MFRRKYIVLVLLLAIGFSPGLLAQIQLILPPQNALDVEPENWLAVRILGNGTGSEQLFLTAELYDASGQLLWQGNSAIFNLSGTETEFLPGQLPLTQSRQMGPIQAGSHQLCLQLRNRTNGQALARQCANRNILDVPKITQADQKPINPFSVPVRVSGQTRLIGQLSNRQNPFRELPQNYLRWEFLPQITVYGIPFRSRLFISTEQQGLRYDINTLSFQLNPQQLQANLRQLAMQKLQAADPELLSWLEQVQADELQDLQEKWGDKWEELQSLDLQEKLHSLQEHDRIQEILQHPSYRGLEKKMQDLQSEFGDLDQQALDSLRIRHPEVFARYQETKSRYRQLLRLRQRLENLRPLAEQGRHLRAMQDKLDRVKQRSPEELLNDPAILRQLPFLKKGQQILSQIRQFGVGTVFPSVSPMAIDGVALDGGHLALQPGRFYVEAMHGNARQTAFGSDSIQNLPESKLSAIRLGVGNPENNHLLFNLMNGRQRDLVSNQVLGIQSGLSFWQDRIALQAEAWHSTYQLQQNTTPAFLQTYPEGAGRYQGWAASARMRIKVLPGQGSLQSYINLLDADYFSLGSPLLIRSRLRFGTQYDQSLFKGKWLSQIFFRQDQNALLPDRPGTSITRSMGAQIQFRPEKGPYVSLQYAPFQQNLSGQDSLFQPGEQSLLNLSAGYSFRQGDNQFSTTLSASHQSGTNANFWQSNLLSLSQTAAFGSNLQFQLSATYLQYDYAIDFDESLALDASGSFRLFSRVQQTFGLNYLSERNIGPRQGLYWQMRTPLPFGMQLGVLARYEFVADLRQVEQEREEYLIRGTMGWRF